ncbi:MAG: protein translocase subunit SecF [Syntrophomonadaceae bacterium]|nr:protein translocase subunit SecF [Syntrophomonadaceae bacterium]
MQIIEKRKIFYILSLLIIIPGIISLAVQGLNLGIDFKGGSVVHVSMDASVTASDVRAVLNKLDLGEFNVQKSGDEFLIRTRELTQEQTKDLINTLEDNFKKVEFLSAESVGATIGSELTRNAVLSLLIAAVLMLIYISIRFEWSFGVAAVTAVIHNVLVVLGVFSLFRWQVNSAFIAAMLTVIGYSINDTIVIFDRVRENLRTSRYKGDYTALLNKSIMQTLNRSVNTVLTSVFALLALMAFGGSTIKLFVLAMLIGFTVGCYSSIFIAGPVWYEIKSRV